MTSAIRESKGNTSGQMPLRGIAPRAEKVNLS